MRGGWYFPFAPEFSASASPAIWRACEAPSIVILELAADSIFPDRPCPIFANRDIVSEVSTESGRHLVLADQRGRYRLLIRASGTRPRSGYLVAADQHLNVRLAALARLHDPACRESGASGRLGLRPSEYQKHRLVLLLRILDRLAEPETCLPTLRTIAMDVVYPHSQLGRAIEWKSSSARRQTQRLVSEARYLMRAGYRDLLKGRMGRSNFCDERSGHYQ